MNPPFCVKFTVESTTSPYKWCEENLGDSEWWFEYDVEPTYYFNNEQDAIMFTLRFK